MMRIDQNSFNFLSFFVSVYKPPTAIEKSLGLETFLQFYLHFDSVHVLQYIKVIGDWGAVDDPDYPITVVIINFHHNYLPYPSYNIHLTAPPPGFCFNLLGLIN